MAKINRRTRGVREPIAEENCPICRKLRKREKKRKIARQNGHKPPRDKNPIEVEKEFQRQWNERFLESPPRAYTIDEYMKRRKEMKEFAHNFWKEYEEKSKKTEKK